jgi:hypothetical protein
MANDELHTAGAEATFPIEYDDSMAAGHATIITSESIASVCVCYQHQCMIE